MKIHRLGNFWEKLTYGTTCNGKIGIFLEKYKVWLPLYVYGQGACGKNRATTTCAAHSNDRLKNYNGDISQESFKFWAHFFDDSAI